MLSHSIHRVMDSAFLKLGGGDPIRADELRAKTTGSLLTFIMTTYIPLWVVVGLLVVHRPQGVDQVGLAEQRDAVKAYAFRYVDAYLKDPSNSALIRQFYDGDVPASVLPPGGRALIPASALPGAIDDGFRTYSVVIDSEIPKAANSKSMVSVPLEVDISIDPHNNLFRAFTLPHANTDRPAGRPVELATQTLISDDRPVYKTVSGFLDAMLLGRGELSPFVAAGTSLRAADPPRFTTLAIERVQADTEDANAQDVPPKADGVEVTVRAVVQTASGVAMPMDFPLVLSVAAGHWQVERINAAPTITAPPDSGSSNSSTTTPTTPTTTSRKPGPATPEGS